MYKKRYLEKYITDDLRDKMVFIGGPRQVGKTTLAKMIAENNGNYAYLNWDSREDRKSILSEKFLADSELLIFDEIHKFRHWKNYVKGIYDKHKDRLKIIVTGSSRLDIYRRGGDSLQGRYHYYRLHPFSLSEAAGIYPAMSAGRELIFARANTALSNLILPDLNAYGGFPEPYIAKNKRTWRRFRNSRLEKLIKEDIRDLEPVRDLSGLQVLADLLPGKAGSLLSINSMREDLGVTHKTVAAWMDILEKMYYHFRIYPYANSAIKSLRKQPKLYLWDWSEAEEGGARFENLIASHLLKFVHLLEDAEGYKVNLRFLRDIEGRETDFIVTLGKKPWFAVEVKLKDHKISKNLLYFKEKLKIPFSYQVIKEGGADYEQRGVRVISAGKFLTALS